jgi:hypothetical protein
MEDLYPLEASDRYRRHESLKFKTARVPGASARTPPPPSTDDQSGDSQSKPELSERRSPQSPRASRRAADFWALEPEKSSDSRVSEHAQHTLGRQREESDWRKRAEGT